MTHIKNQQCQHCHTFFIPDHRNRKRQKFCSLPECRQASKKASQQRWFTNNTGYFKGAENVLRVQEWRQANPGYRKGKGKKDVLQDNCPPNTTERQDNIEIKSRDILVEKGATRVLQDILTAQHPVLIGLIMQITGLALQDDIAKAAVRLAHLGEDFLNGVTTLTQGGHNDPQAPNLS